MDSRHRREPLRLIIAHLGARQHYQLSRGAERNGVLARLITDFWNPFGWGSTGIATALRWPLLMRMASRCTKGIPLRKVIALYHIGLCGALIRRRCHDNESLYRHFLTEGQDFARQCIRWLDINHNVFIGFASGALESLRFERSQGRAGAVVQFDAARMHARIVSEEESRFPELAPLGRTGIPESYFARLEEEWDEARCVIVASEWTRRALIEQGVPSCKIEMLPLAYSGPQLAFEHRRSSKLRVLWLGNVTLSKGIVPTIEAARLLEKEGVSFTIGGPIGIRMSTLSLPTNMKIIGPVPRNMASSFYASHDLFILPTLSDGFAITQIEAMAHGLPVVATPCCGAVVEDGVSGFIIPARDSQALAEAIRKFRDDPNLIERFSIAAITRSKDFSPEAIWPQEHGVYRRIADCHESAHS